MFKVIEVHPLPYHRIRVRFDNRVEGEVDLSYLVGKGVFKAFEEPSFFEQVYVGEFGDVRWPGDIDLCPDALYLKVTGQTPEQAFPSLAQKKAFAHA